jgi:hypothetical protein
MSSFLPAEIYSTAHLDYIQRTSSRPGPPAQNVPPTSSPVVQRRLFRIVSVGRACKYVESQNFEQDPRLPTEDLLIGLSGYRLPLAFQLAMTPEGLSLHLGVWQPERDGAALVSLDQGQEVLLALVRSLYPAVNAQAEHISLSPPPSSGLALGIPTARRPEPADGAVPIDRLIRAMRGSCWACMILAQPVPETKCVEMRDVLTNEIRRVLTSAQDRKEPSPLATQYAELLTTAQKSANVGLAGGMWRTAVYLMGDSLSYPRLASVWRGIFSGEKSQPEPVRVWDLKEAGPLAVNWSLLNDPGPPGPGGFYKHPFAYQTLLTSSQLSAYVHMPQLETAGFAIHMVPAFDVVPPAVQAQKPIALGSVILNGEQTRNEYKIDPKTLSKHVCVAGVTGAGKTNTVFHLLKELYSAGKPFLVIEPAKREYRALLNDPVLGGKLRVYTLGDERVSPFRLNPFEVLPGRVGKGDPPHWPVGQHLDLLRSVFTVSFGMWNPLPHVLEQCLHAVYQDRGWEITSGRNRRLESACDAWAAFPTLSDLLAKVDEVVGSLGYEDKIAADMRAALRTRINSLRAGGKGRMLDVRRSFGVESLLGAPTVLELEGIGDDDDKAFVMGLLFIRLVQYQRALGQSRELRHLMVIEEAHRLLTNVSAQGNPEQADPRGKAVETFASLLSEIRAYGQGIMIADQAPVRLAPDVIKNTNLKIAHRIVSKDDRVALAGAMSMNDQQTEALSTLHTGEAAVFSEGDDAPVLIHVTPSKDNLADRWPEDGDVADSQKGSVSGPAESGFLLPLPTCAESCPLGPDDCQAARTIVEETGFRRVFRRFALSAAEDETAPPRLWPEILAIVQSKRLPGTESARLLQCVLVRASDWLAEQRGAQGGWPYSGTREYANRLRELLRTVAAGDQAVSALESQFRESAQRLHARTFPPYPGCAEICRQSPPVCLYRQAAGEIITLGRYTAPWRAANAKDAPSAGRKESWAVCQDVAFEMIQWPDDSVPPELKVDMASAARRAALCFGQQMLARDQSPGIANRVLTKLLAEAKHG